MTRQELKEHRSRLGVTQVGLAELLHVPTSTVQNWEQGLRPIPEWAAHHIPNMQPKVRAS